MAERGSDQWRARVRDGTRRGREAAAARRRHERKLLAVAPSDIAALHDSGAVRPELKPLGILCAEEHALLLEAIAGADDVEEITPQRRMLVGDAIRVGAVLRAEMFRYFQSGDSDAAARVGTLAGQRRASLALLGLDRRAREVLDLETIIAEHDAEGGSGATKSNGRESSVVVDGEVAASEETSS